MPSSSPPASVGLPQVQADALRGLERLGIELDAARNDAAAAGARRISTAGCGQRTVVPTNEELAIARDVVDLLD